MVCGLEARSVVCSLEARTVVWRRGLSDGLRPGGPASLGTGLYRAELTPWIADWTTTDMTDTDK